VTKTASRVEGPGWPDDRVTEWQEDRRTIEAFRTLRRARDVGADLARIASYGGDYMEITIEVKQDLAEEDWRRHLAATGGRIPA
jgi:hypothetical protein